MDLELTDKVAEGKRRSYLACGPLAVLAALWAIPSMALGADPIPVDTESELRAAWSNPRVTAIDVTDDIFLRACERATRSASRGGR